VIRRARPPAVGAVQISPRQAKAIVFPSGKRFGWDGRNTSSAAANSEYPTARVNKLQKRKMLNEKCKLQKRSVRQFALFILQ
jgi:hypothetical protein